jgi:hypothetical protein
MDNPFQPMKSQWLAKIKKGQECKKDFQQDADEAMAFFNGPYDFLYQSKTYAEGRSFVNAGDGDFPRPTFQMTVNKASEMVQLFVPSLYHQNPNRKVNPRQQPILPPNLFGDPNDPMVQQTYMPMAQGVMHNRTVDQSRAVLLEYYLNYTPSALDLKAEARDAVEEALLKGAGCLWTETYTPKGAQWKMIGSFYDTIDNLVIDCDMESLRDAKWIARRCVHPVWEVEQEYGLAPGALKANAESPGNQAALSQIPEGSHLRARGDTNDLLVYWKVYSKMGMGSLMTGIDKASAEWDRFGTYCYLAVCHGCEYPLNLPPEVWENDEEIYRRVQWETPFWADDAWPCSILAFHKIPRKVWPQSHLKPGMGELKFINWAYSFIASKIRTACRDLIVCDKGLEEEITRAIISGTDYELIKLSRSHGKTINEVVQFLQHPPFQGDIWRVIQAIEANFEKRVGLTELMYGLQNTADRSAAASQIKGDQMRIRPDDMANKVEDWMTEVARKETLAARTNLEPQRDIVPIMGQEGAAMWEQLVTAADPSVIIHQLECRVEANSVRKPNQGAQQESMAQVMQVIAPVIQQYMFATGDPTAWNAMMQDFGTANGIQGMERYQLAPLAPPMPAGPQIAPESQEGAAA